MGLLITLIVIFTEIFASITDLQLSSKNTSNVADDGRYIYSRFIYDVNRAESISTPINEGETTNTLSLIINGDSYNYTLANGVLSITDPTGSYALNGYGSQVVGLSFTKIGTGANSTVRINFTVNGIVTKQGLSDQQSFQTTAGLR
ncbi:MAG: hypothetical protein Q7T54_05525 [Candidatus Levybacteria bacterium]|nr:hypothetical protein [Candidatus Levybacteria bacterium]